MIKIQCSIINNPSAFSVIKQTLNLNKVNEGAVVIVKNDILYYDVSSVLKAIDWHLRKSIDLKYNSDFGPLKYSKYERQIIENPITCDGRTAELVLRIAQRLLECVENGKGIDSNDMNKALIKLRMKPLAKWTRNYVTGGISFEDQDQGEISFEQALVEWLNK